MRRSLTAFLFIACFAGCGESDPDETPDKWPDGFYLVVDPDAILIAVDSSFTMNWQVYTAMDHLSGKPSIPWTSSNTNVATVDPDGTVHVVGLGTANITGATRDLHETIPVIGVLGGTQLGRASAVGSAVTPPWSVVVQGDNVYIGTSAGGGVYPGSVASRTVATAPISFGAVYDLLLSAAGDTAWVGDTPGGEVSAIALPGANVLASTSGLFADDVFSLARSADGNTIFAGGATGEIASLTSDLVISAVWPTNLGSVLSLEVDDSRSRVYAGMGSAILFLTIENDTITASQMLMGATDVKDLQRSADGTTLFAAVGNVSGLTIINLVTGQVTVAPMLGIPVGLALSPNGQSLAVTTTGWGGRVTIYNTQTNSFTRTWHVGGEPGHVAFAPGEILVVPNTHEWVDFLQ